MTLKFQVLSSNPWPIDFENHSEQLHTVPKKFASYGLLVKLTKCQFTKKSFTFFEHILSGDGV